MYPVSGVRVYLRTELTGVRVDDLRDYTKMLLGGQWTYKNRLVEIARKLGDLVGYIKDREDQPKLLQKLGEYHLGEGFSI